MRALEVYSAQIIDCQGQRPYGSGNQVPGSFRSSTRAACPDQASLPGLLLLVAGDQTPTCPRLVQVSSAVRYRTGAQAMPSSCSCCEASKGVCNSPVACRPQISCRHGHGCRTSVALIFTCGQAGSMTSILAVSAPVP